MMMLTPGQRRNFTRHLDTIYCLWCFTDVTATGGHLHHERRPEHRKAVVQASARHVAARRRLEAEHEDSDSDPEELAEEARVRKYPEELHVDVSGRLICRLCDGRHMRSVSRVYVRGHVFSLPHQQRLSLKRKLQLCGAGECGCGGCGYRGCGGW